MHVMNGILAGFSSEGTPEPSAAVIRDAYIKVSQAGARDGGIKDTVGNAVRIIHRDDHPKRQRVLVARKPLFVDLSKSTIRETHAAFRVPVHPSHLGGCSAT